MRALTVNGVAIDDTFAEAFDMRATALVITAPTVRWALQAAATMTGFATSVIACGCEAGVDRTLSPRETPDGRPGVRVLMFAVSTSELQRQLQNRVGQCVLTSPGSACYAGLDAGEEKLKLGAAIRFFGDGWQIAKKLGSRRYWRVPVMDGEFVCESTTYLTKNAVGGGNLLIMGASAGQHARGGGGGGQGDARGRRRHHAVSRRHRPLGLEGRLEIQGRERVDQRRLLSDLEGRGRQRSRARNRLGARNRHRRPHQRGCRRRRCARGSPRSSNSGPSAAHCALAPAITAANSAGTTITSRSSCREAADLHLARGADPAPRSVAADPAKSREQDDRGNRPDRTSNDARARDRGRRFPHP